MTEIRILRTPEEFARYEAWVKSHPQGSLWQSLEWKQYQAALGREMRIYVVEDSSEPSPQPSPLQGRGCSMMASALVVIDRTTFGWSTWDIPRGPLWNSQIPSSKSQKNSKLQIPNNLLHTILEHAKRDRCLALSLSPPQSLPPTPPSTMSSPRHRALGIETAPNDYPLQPSPRHEQPTATRVIDLTQSEDDILAKMHQKGRYNIHVARNNGVRVEESRNVAAFYNLLQETAQRDGFRILPPKAYRAFLERLPGSFLLMAFPPSPFTKGEGQGERVEKPIAGLLGVVWPPAPHPNPLPRGEGKTGIYYYGASDYASRALMAPYALQWEAMRLCKTRGCTRYDLLGVTPRTINPSPCPLPRGEGATSPQHHPWAGVSAFKEKFGGTVVTYPPEQQIVLRSIPWRALQWKRKIYG